MALLGNRAVAIVLSGTVRSALVAEDGKVRIPDGPGWGVEINEAWLAASRYQKSEL